MKVHIIGIAASGKTSLADWTSRAFNIPAFDLDYVVYDSRTGLERPREEIERRVTEIRANEGWITEGAYRDAWLEGLLDDADYVIWLDPPLVRCLWRAVKRHALAELRRSNPHPGWWRLASFVHWNRRTGAQQRAETEALLAPYEAKTARCRSSGDVARLKEHLELASK